MIVHRTPMVRIARDAIDDARKPVEMGFGDGCNAAAAQLQKLAKSLG